MVGRWISFWDGPFADAMLVSGSVHHDVAPMSPKIFVLLHHRKWTLEVEPHFRGNDPNVPGLQFQQGSFATNIWCQPWSNISMMFTQLRGTPERDTANCYWNQTGSPHYPPQGGGKLALRPCVEVLLILFSTLLLYISSESRTIHHYFNCFIFSRCSSNIFCI